MTERYDAIVVGGGPGGYPAALRLAQLGLRVVVVEGDKVGGVCLHKGCVPTKALLRVAETITDVRASSSLGIVVGTPALDYGEVASYRDRVVDRLHTGVRSLLRRHKVEVVSGWGRLTSATTVEVINSDGNVFKELEASNVVLATGSRPRQLPGLAFDGVRVLSSDHAVTRDKLPASVIVVGSGAVGTEFASFYIDAGVSKVTLMEMAPRILPLEDRDVSIEVGRQLSARGVVVVTKSTVEPASYRSTAEGVSIQAHELGGSSFGLSAEVFLIAIGRSANTEYLGLEEIGVEFDGEYVAVDTFMRTNIANVYAIGDVVGGPLLAHKATAEGVLVAEVIAGERVDPINYSLVPRCTFSRPEVASLGLSEEAAAAGGRRIVVGKSLMSANSRAVVDDRRDGFVKIITDSDTGDIVGVHAVGHHVTEMIAEAGIAMFPGGAATHIAKTIHAHPTLSESFAEAALATYGAMLNQ